jgi:cell wall-associated NlpC family hydrolase
MNPRRGGALSACIALAFVAFATLAAPPLAAGAVTTTNVGGVVVTVDGDGPTPSPAVRPNRAKSASATVRPADAESGGDPGVGQPTSPLGDELVRYALSLVGVPYVWAGSSPDGFDCSGFTQYVFQRLGVSLPRTADAQFAAGRPVSDPMPGDLVFFQTYDWGASHVGIYLGNGYFVNAIRPDVHVSSFASSYFRGRYLGARRFLSA